MRHLNLVGTGQELAFKVKVVVSKVAPTPEVTVDVGGSKYEGVAAQEVLKKLQTSRSILFHNSTEPDPDLTFGSGLGELGELAAQQNEQFKIMEKYVDKTMKKIAKAHRQSIEDLLGCLKKKYRVGLSLPAYDFSYLPFILTLGEKRYEVALDDWGSGTKNRTMVLLTLFMAKQISQSQASASKITPIIVIEEPECFLHPAAQAEFGKVLQDLAAAFSVQVIVTTHSPYMLNIANPSANILLDRRIYYNQPLETQHIPTAGEHWMQPFGQALGLNAEEFKPWRNLFLSSKDALLLVEGDTDKEYFEMLRAPAHGACQLKFDGEIAAYDGTGSLSNTVLLRFLKNRHDRFFVTYDLDSETTVEKNLKTLSLERNKDYCAIGLNVAGKRNIEGLLPDRVVDSVNSSNGALVRAAVHGNTEEQKSAKSRLKKLMLEEFKRSAVPGPDDFKHFYAVSRVINRTLGQTAP